MIELFIEFVLQMLKPVHSLTKLRDVIRQRLSFQSDYRPAGAKVEVNTNAQAGVVVLTAEKRRELQERLARLQAQMAIEDERKH